MSNTIKAFSHSVSHYRSDFHRQREVKNHNLFSACFSAIANVPKNISIDKTIQKITADLAHARDTGFSMPLCFEDNKGIWTLNADRTKFLGDTALNMRNAVNTFEDQYKISSLSGKNLKTFTDLREKMTNFKANFGSSIQDFKASANRQEACIKMLNANTIDPIFNAMLDKYTKLEKSPVRESTTLSFDALKTSFDEIVNPGYGTPDSGAISKKGDAAAQIIKAFLSSPHTVHISDVNITKLEQAAFNDYMNQQLQELDENDRELTLSLYQAFATHLDPDPAPKNVKSFDRDVSSTFFGQAIILKDDFLKSCKTEGNSISVREATHVVSEKFIAYIKTTVPEINPPA